MLSSLVTALIRRKAGEMDQGIKKTARKVDKMFEGHDRLCRFETSFLRGGFVH